LGRAGKTEHVLTPGDIPVIHTDRGGQVTYHGPGQLVVYLLLDTTRLELGIRQLVDHIEQSIIKSLADYSINAQSRRDAPGVYVNDRKIAALGLRVRRSGCYHGLSLNLDMDLEPFSRINPCGFASMEVTQVKDLLPAWSNEPALQEKLPLTLLGNLTDPLGYARISIIEARR
jgi:lipoyl(octanoyl) transferase